MLFFSALLTAGLTAFYTFRGYFKTFWGEEKFPTDVHHPHEAPPMMAWPLRILAVRMPLGVGFVLAVLPLHALRADFLDSRWIDVQFHEMTTHHGPNFLLMAYSSIIALVGIGTAYLMYVKQPDLAGIASRKLAGLYEMSCNKFYFDEIYELVIIKPLTVIAHVCKIVDTYLIDGLVDLIGSDPGVRRASWCGRFRTAWCSSTPLMGAGARYWGFCVVGCCCDDSDISPRERAG